MPNLTITTDNRKADGRRAVAVQALAALGVPDAAQWVDAAIEAASRAAGGPAGLDDWPDEPELPGAAAPDPLPLDALTPALRSYVVSVATSTQTPTDLAALLSLVCVSAAVGGRAVVDVDARGWREPLSLYAIAILPPASRKSSVYALLTAPIVEWERDARERIAPQWRRARDRVEVAEAALANVKAAAAKGKASPDELEAARIDLDEAEAAVPVMPRLLVSDTTPEALVCRMAEQGGRIALLAPEGDPLRIADGRYSDGSARIAELKQAWSGEAITVDRIGREPIHIAHPALTLGLTMQPGVLETLKNARVMRGEGLFARILWILPPHGLGRRLTGRDVPPLDAVAAAEYERTIRALLDAAYADDGESAPRRMRLDEGALDTLYDYEAEIERELADGARLAGIRDWAGKVCGQAVRMAALLELAARAEDGRPLWSDPIGAWAMQSGVRLARALTTHALVVLGEMGMDREAALAAYVLRRAVQMPEGSTLRDLYEATKGRADIEDMDDLRAAVDGLVARGCLRLVDRVRTGPGRPPSPRIEIHPNIRNSHSHNSHNTAQAIANGNSANSANVDPGGDDELWEAIDV